MSDRLDTIHLLQIGFLVGSLLGVGGMSELVVRTRRPAPLWFAVGIVVASIAATALFVNYTVRTSERGIGRAAAIGTALTVGVVTTLGMVGAALGSYWIHVWS